MSDVALPFGAGVMDLAAVLWFFACWVGYTYVADHLSRGDDNVVAIQHRYRRRWMELMLKRDMRMGDVQIVATIMRSSSLFASTTLFILAGLVTILGALDRARDVASSLSFAIDAPRELWEIKVLVLILIFVYAFFKFAWAMRQNNIALVVIGAAPLPGHDDGTDHGEFAERAARVLTRAVNTFNRGQRAYYFGLATLSWFIQPWCFVVASVWVVAVLYRREFRSLTLRALAAGGVPGADGGGAEEAAGDGEANA
jgi:uncharacterized membrane protein